MKKKKKNNTDSNKGKQKMKEELEKDDRSVERCFAAAISLLSYSTAESVKTA